MLKKISLLALAGIAFLQAGAQTDSTAKAPSGSGDTVHIGNIIILKNGAPSSSTSEWNVNVYRKRKSYPANLTTEWAVLDLGFSNFNDKTNYAALNSGFAAGSDDSWFNLRNGKSVNVNIWILMQRLNLIKHVVNLKYGVGLELNNYRYDNDIRYTKNPPGVYLDSDISYSKDKLAADYVTVPIMLNFNFSPRNRESRSFGLSAGVSGGYLYSARNKYISDETGKQKTKGDLGLRDFKLSYIAEVQLGPIKLYGSYATESMFREGLDQTPYNFGIRLAPDSW